jgi:CheY-like chemotaxis protein
MKELRLLYVEDSEDYRKNLIKIFSDRVLCNYSIKIEAVESFDNAIEKITENKYHIIILDIYKGKPDENGEQAGLSILQQIQEKYFIPVIFFSALTNVVQELRSQIVGVVTKGDEGIDGLKQEIERLVKFNLPFVKENIHNYLDKEFIKYFWNIIHKENDKFTVDKDDFSLGYLMLRKFANSLSKENISKILGYETLKDKVHPMEFYLYPTDVATDLESGEILKKGDNVYVILTPSCDFIERFDRNGKNLGRKVEKILLAKTKLLSETNEQIEYVTKSNNDTKDKLIKLIESRKGDRYFFLPRTPFIENRIIDFQIKEMIDYNELGEYERLAKLDSPFAESMTSSFIRYYNRIGTPDIDSDLIINFL